MSVIIDIAAAPPPLPANETVTWQSGWCPECPANPMQVEIMSVDTVTLLATWRCEAGHEWATSPDTEN